MRTLTKLLFPVGAAAGLFIGAMPSAMAGTDASASICNSGCTTTAATAYFFSNGDNFQVCDTLTDGYSAVLQGNRPDGSYFQRWNNNGGGSCQMYYFDFTEGGTVTFQVCLGVSSTGAIVRCSPLTTGIA